MREDILVGINVNKRGMNEVLVDLERLGFKLKDTLSNIHFLFGELDTSKIHQAKKIKGIYSIEFDRVVHGVADEE